MDNVTDLNPETEKKHQKIKTIATATVAGVAIFVVSFALGRGIKNGVALPIPE